MGITFSDPDVDTDPDVADLGALTPADGDLALYKTDGTRWNGIQPSALTVTSTGGTAKTLAAWTDDILDVTTDSGIVYAADYVTVGSTSDQSTEMQAALTAATGGKLILPEATIFCKNLSIPADTDIEGVSEDKSILKLPNSSDTYVLASAGYVSNSSTVDLGGRYSNFRVDGNKSNQTTAKPAMILRTYRAHCDGITVASSKGRGLLLTALSANNTAVSNGMAENVFNNRCCFQQCDQEGWYGEDGGAIQLADWVIENCVIFGNGGTTKYNVYSERSAGTKFLNNQCYMGGIGEARFEGASRMVISGNHVDIADPGATSGNVYGIYVTLGGHATVSITGNQFHNNEASAGSVTWQHLLITSLESDARAAVCGNTFYSESFSHTSWTCGGSAIASHAGNGYYNMSAPAPSANVAPDTGVIFDEITSTQTWTKPVGCTAVVVEIMGGGGGGGGGARVASGTQCSGGGGGGGGGFSFARYQASDLPASLTVTIGAGGTSGAGSTSDGVAGSNGGAGGDSSFGAFGQTYALIGYRGGAGAGGQVAGNAGGGAGAGIIQVGGNASTGTGGTAGTGGGNGGSGAAGAIGANGGSGGGGCTNAAAGSNGGGASIGGAGGGAGGGISSAPASFAGGNGGGTNAYTGPTGGANTGAAGTAGTAMDFRAGTAGSGGGGNASGAGGAGGAGAYGSGGGGGGAGLGANGGAGGAGGSGIARIWSFY